MRSARPAAFSRRGGGALTGAAVPAVPGAGLWRGAGRCPGGWPGLPLGAGEPPLAKGPGWGSCAGSRFAPPGSAVRAERPWDVCGDGRGVPELGPGVSTSSPTSGLCRPAAPGRHGRSGRAGAVPGARGCPRAGACPAGKRDVVEKGARRCSGTWNPHQCFPNVLAEIRPWGSCREGCPAQLPRMGLPRLSSPGGRGTCSRLVLPVKFGKSGERLPDGPCVPASCASLSRGPARAARLGTARFLLPGSPGGGRATKLRVRLGRGRRGEGEEAKRLHRPRAQPARDRLLRGPGGSRLPGKPRPSGAQGGDPGPAAPQGKGGEHGAGGDPRGAAAVLSSGVCAQRCVLLPAGRDLWCGLGAPAGARASSSKRQSCSLFLTRDCLHAGNSTGDGPRGSAWDAAPAGAALGALAREDEPR